MNTEENFSRIFSGEKFQVAENVILLMWPKNENEIYSVLMKYLLDIRSEIIEKSTVRSIVRYLILINKCKESFIHIGSYLRKCLETVNNILLIQNIVILYPDWQNIKGFDVHIMSSTKGQSTSSKCVLENLNILEMDSENLKVNKLYSEVQIRDFEKCTMAVEFSGINATSRKIVPEFEKVLISAILEAMHVKLSHVGFSKIVVGGYTIGSFLHRLFPIFSFPHLSVNMKWYVPCNKQLARHGNFMKTFQWPVWLSMTFVFFITTPFIYWISKMERSLNLSIHFVNLSNF